MIRIEGPGAQAWLADKSRIVIEEVDDPAAAERLREAHEHSERNLTWLVGHWPDSLPAALGQFVAVAGQEAFIAADSLVAWESAHAAHPEDKGILVQYVNPAKRPGTCANRWGLGPLAWWDDSAKEWRVCEPGEYPPAGRAEETVLD
jgi:hypothetical protein